MSCITVCKNLPQSLAKAAWHAIKAGEERTEEKENDFCQVLKFARTSLDIIQDM